MPYMSQLSLHQTLAIERQGKRRRNSLRHKTKDWKITIKQYFRVFFRCTLFITCRQLILKLSKIYTEMKFLVGGQVKTYTKQVENVRGLVHEVRPFLG